MKRIMLVLISVVMFFTACENASNNSIQTNPFDNVTLGMSVVEFIDNVGRQPDKIFKYRDDDRYDEEYTYYDEEFLGVYADSVECSIKDYELKRIEVWYHYDDESETEQAYLTLKDELLKRYPEGEFYIREEKKDFSIEMENYMIILSYMDHTIWLVITDFLKSTEIIDHSENLDSITLGMTKEQVIDTIGRQPDEDWGLLGLDLCSYDDELCFNVSNANVQYNFNDDMLYRIQISYFYPSEEEQLSIDFVTIKEELLNSYPEETRKDFHDEGTELSFYADNAYVTLSSETYADVIMVTIENKNRYLK